ncbi:MAG: hypothetical protein ACM3OC_00200 [Deltaproteobacteria bacterium]
MDKKKIAMGVLLAIVLVPPLTARAGVSEAVKAKAEKAAARAAEQKAAAENGQSQAPAGAAGPVNPAQTREEAKPQEAAELSESPEQDLNPFVTEEENRFFDQKDETINLDSVNLTAVFYSPSKAIIDGKILQEGDFVDGKQIVQIHPESVVLKAGKQTYIVRLQNVN